MNECLSLFAIVLALEGCCLEVSGTEGELGTSGTSGGVTNATGGMTSSGATSGGSIPCAVPPSGSITVTTLAGNGGNGFFDGSGGRDGTTEFSLPTSVAVDTAGNAYVADFQNNRIRKVASDGTTITVAGNGQMGFRDGTGGPNGTAEFDSPFALALDDSGNLLVVDDAVSVRKVDRDGNVTTLVGALSFVFTGLHGIAINQAGNILVSDSGRVRVLDSSGNATVLASGGSIWPTGLAVGPDGSVYFADDSNTLHVGDVIRKIDVSGNVTIFAGNGDLGFVDGPGSNAEFAMPLGKLCTGSEPA